eukprot:Amastigsp_a971_56.p3 type:complete len:123 gc:universal Amastigsp_a971_56:112-480(+)
MLRVVLWLCWQRCRRCGPLPRFSRQAVVPRARTVARASGRGTSLLWNPELRALCSRLRLRGRRRFFFELEQEPLLWPISLRVRNRFRPGRASVPSVPSATRRCCALVGDLASALAHAMALWL